MDGVREELAAFGRSESFQGLARFRHFGSEGPLYEVLADHGDRVRVRVVESGEELDYPTTAADQDPLA